MVHTASISVVLLNQYIGWYNNNNNPIKENNISTCITKKVTSQWLIETFVFSDEELGKLTFQCPLVDYAQINWIVKST